MSTQETPSTPITPAHIDTDRHFWDGFGNRETEISANWIVRFCQQLGQGWAPISLHDLQAYYNQEREGRPERFSFNRLASEGYVLVEGDKVVLTARFVATCYMVSPKA